MIYVKGAGLIEIKVREASNGLVLEVTYPREVTKASKDGYTVNREFIAPDLDAAVEIVARETRAAGEMEQQP